MSNKLISSLAIKLVYQNPNPPPLNDVRQRQLFNTLFSSTTGTSSRGCTLYPYYQYVQWLLISDWRISNKNELIQVVSKILQFGRLRHLEVVFNKTDLVPNIGSSANLAALRSLTICYNENSWKRLQKWFSNLLPRVHLESLFIQTFVFSGHPPWEIFASRNATLRSLTVTELYPMRSASAAASFTRTFLEKQSESLSSLSLTRVSFSVATLLPLPRLERICFFGTRVEGWNILCKSLTTLRSLSLNRVELVGVAQEESLSELPVSVLCDIETLDVDFPFRECWLETHSSSFQNLRHATIASFSESALKSMIGRCNLESFHFSDCRQAADFILYGKHLELFSQTNLPNLKSLFLCKGEFTSDCIVNLPLEVL